MEDEEGKTLQKNPRSFTYVFQEVFKSVGKLLKGNLSGFFRGGNYEKI